ncbi:MAG: DUF5666 domain-containing protein [Chloroflexota bacterium]|nr:DUF5666 domain-containing protein [Chloroflexota bacterium]
MQRLRILFLAAFVLALVAGVVVGSRWLPTTTQTTASALSAEEGGPTQVPSVSLEGVLHVVGEIPGFWLVDSFPFEVIPETTIVTNGVPLEPDVWARVEAIKLPSGFQATSIELSLSPVSDIFDRILAMDGNLLWDVGNSRVIIVSPDDISGDPEIGKLAAVHGRISPEGLVADHVIVLDSDTEVAIDGSIVELNATEWVVDDLTVEIDSNTVIHGTPAIGARVQIRAEELDNGNVLALEVWVVGSLPGVQNLVGWLQRIQTEDNPSIWRVNLLDGPDLSPVFMGIYDDTVVDESGGAAVPDAWLEMEATHMGDGYYYGHHIKVLPRAPKRQLVGLVESLPDYGYEGPWEVGGYPVIVNDQTAIVGVPEVGALVWMTGVPDFANILHVQLIEVLGE